MADSGIDHFCSETGIARSTVEALGDLDDAQFALLTAAFQEASDRRATELDTATNDGLQVVPRLIRPAVKRFLFT